MGFHWTDGNPNTLNHIFAWGIVARGIAKKFLGGGDSSNFGSDSNKNYASTFNIDVEQLMGILSMKRRVEEEKVRLRKDASSMRAKIRNIYKASEMKKRGWTKQQYDEYYAEGTRKYLEEQRAIIEKFPRAVEEAKRDYYGKYANRTFRKQEYHKAFDDLGIRNRK